MPESLIIISFNLDGTYFSFSEYELAPKIYPIYLPPINGRVIEVKEVQ